jgi:hypothetical protein
VRLYVGEGAGRVELLTRGPEQSRRRRYAWPNAKRLWLGGFRARLTLPGPLIAPEDCHFAQLVAGYIRSAWPARVPVITKRVVR